ncbi:Receptor-type tyrosine-protein phosphatase C [Dufourea novaeangliae]|uniref:Receptor-type tyrosine-protein phosphatase C n=2 Tax=Dufourea novaeangliae TaxID=178035 RepID=A0A154PSH5_DUFNO|nr:Receptor-type tyrosine-protein phosphatase C [Dufourea novaeangliae]
MRDVIDEKNQQKPEERSTEKPNHETSTPQDSSSPIPRGRTIAFSGINEFPNLETKPTTTPKIDVTLSKKNISGEKLTDQRPYPYVKSTVKEEVHNTSNQVDATTEEVSAFENTIGRGQSDEKFIVTEASDVLENSIQQLKPTYHEKAGNESSTVSTAPPRPSIPMTTVTLDEPRPTNLSAVDEPIDPKTITKPEEKSTTTGNDVPRWSEGREAITGRGNFDMTGNGITEVSVKPESVDKRTYGPSFHESDRATTAKPQTTAGMPSNADVQTNPESSMLIRSTLNATELATETITEPPGILDANGTNEIPSGVNGLSSLDENFVPTTTAIEYEFVGLSEATTVLGPNITEETSQVHGLVNDTMTVPTVQDLFTKSSSNETSTVKIATVTDNSSTGETEMTSTDERSTGVPVTDQTISPTSMSTPTTQLRDEITTEANVIDEDTVQSSTKEDDGQKTSVTETWTTITDDDIGTTVRSEELYTPDSKDSRSALNTTETIARPTETTSISTTDATRVVSSSPFVPSTRRPEVRVSSTTSTPAVSGIPMETTDDTKVSPTQEITSLVRIVMEGNWNDVCPKMDKLRVPLAEVLTSGLNKSVSDKQIMFHRQPPCPEVSSSTPTPSDMPLTSIWVYVVDEDGKFDGTMTNSFPSLYQKSKDHVKFPVTIHSFLLVRETIPDSGNAIAVVVVSVVAFICLVLLAGLLFIMRKRQTRFNYGERCRPVSLDAYSVDSVSAYNSVRRKGVARSSKRSYGNPTFEDSSAIPSHPLNFAGLSSFCNDVNAINEEFAGIPQVSAKIDELPTGAELKNRYANVIPLPETRVPLQKINNDPLTEYINASYVRGPKNAMRYYIACQAPMDATITDFWRMIWEQQCKVIIMLTDLVENGVEKCTEYIPPSEITDCHRLYGDFQVTLKKRETKEKYAISTLHLKNLENNTFREVYHIWYLWPVNGAQSDGAGLIAVLLEARALQRGGPGPIVVHCSPGTGRTGTLIALDLGIRQYEITRTVDVPRVIYTIRRDRAGAVQTKEQYAFIYKALNLYATKLAGGVLDST